MTKSPATKEKYTETIGRRKTAVARVRIMGEKKSLEKTHSAKEGETQLTINDKKFTEYFLLPQLQKKVLAPLEKLGILTAFSISVHVRGGGIAAQAQAVQHGIARALVDLHPDLRKKIKKFGYLTRDARMVERKKYGLKKARRAPQWSKR